MRKFIIFIVIIVAAAFLFKNFMQSGQFDRYLDSHPNPGLNPAIEYYWGMLLDLANRTQSSEYRFMRIVEKYPKSDYAPAAWVEYIEILDNKGDRGKVLSESKKFMQSEYASSPKAAIIKRKMQFIEHGY